MAPGPTPQVRAKHAYGPWAAGLAVSPPCLRETEAEDVS